MATIPKPARPGAAPTHLGRALQAAASADDDSNEPLDDDFDEPDQERR